MVALDNSDGSAEEVAPRGSEVGEAMSDSREETTIGVPGRVATAIPLVALALAYLGVLSAARSAPTPASAPLRVAAPPRPVASIQASAPLIAVDTRTRRVFGCDVRVPFYDTDPTAALTLAIADEARGTALGHIPLAGCAGVAADTSSGHVFVFGDGGRTLVLDATRGAVLAHVPGFDGEVVGVAPLPGRLVVAYNPDGRVSYPQSGFGVTVGSTAHGPDRRGAVAEIDTRTGRLLPVPTLDPAGAPVLGLDAAAGTLYLQRRDGDVDAIPLAGGPRMRLATRGRAVNQTIALATDGRAGHVFVGRISYLPGVTAPYPPPLSIGVYARATGRLLRTLRVPLAGDDIVFSLADDPSRHRLAVALSFGSNVVDVLDDRTGRVLARSPVVDGQPELAADPVAGRLYLVTVPAPERDQQYPSVSGSMVALDEGSGRVLSRLDAGEAALAVLVDGVAGRAFSCSGGVTMMDARARPGAFGYPLPTDPVPPPARAHARDTLYVARTRHTLSGPFRDFWLRYGGVPTLGNPLSQPFSDGTHTVQDTERAEMVLDRGRVSLAPLGLDARGGDVEANNSLATGDTEPSPFRRLRPFPSRRGRLYVAARGHALSGPFLAFWRAHNGAVTLGPPISEVFTEGNGDGSGRRYAVQWFVRGRLEEHPKSADPAYRVQVGLLGLDVVRGRGWLPTPPTP